MDVTRTRALRGPNLWSRHMAIEAVVTCAENERAVGQMAGFEARLRALVRRSADPGATPVGSNITQIGAIRYDKDSGALYLHGEVMELTPRELALMHALLAQPGHAVTKERLYELVFPGQLDVQYEAIEVVVYRLRKKLVGTGLTLMTLRGLGYLLRTDA